MHDRSTNALRRTIAELQSRLAKSEDALRAIRSGEVDVLMVATSVGEEVYSPQSADQPAREIIEAMGEGAVNVTPDVTDLTEQTRAEAIRDSAEADLRAAGSYARGLLEASLDPLVTINAAAQNHRSQQGDRGTTGLPRDQLVGRDFSDCFTEPEKARAEYRRVFAEGVVTDRPLAIRNVSGPVVEVLYNASTYRDENGKVIGVLAAARDITARRRRKRTGDVSTAPRGSLLLNAQPIWRKQIRRSILPIVN